MNTKPATPLNPVQTFYGTRTPANAIRLALADHAAHCSPMQPMSEFTKALNRALDQVEAYPELVAALRALMRAEEAYGDENNVAVNHEWLRAKETLAKLGEDK